MDRENSYHSRQCAFEIWDRSNMPCWGKVLTTEVIVTEEGDFMLNTCSGHRLMMRNGPYIVEPDDGSTEFDGSE